MPGNVLLDTKMKEFAEIRSQFVRKELRALSLSHILVQLLMEIKRSTEQITSHIVAS